MTVAVGSKTPPISFPAFLFFVEIEGLYLTISLFCDRVVVLFCVCLHRSREFKLQLPVLLRGSSSTSSANKMYLVAGQRG
ncbi:hypothetical protein N7471_000718 [Penicillium samsonianum]|uniref:uncharacterized protein n=1 Tax=Penicillium samsonianum TaxID=1882272 RepID=UPI002547CFE0|nr:uncharacterized protein N7471_000718 [Penicillium samsonianum]KAJ6149519.1 hypothetical protein N7471_000718 [Penicillium samsonianum]